MIYGCRRRFEKTFKSSDPSGSSYKSKLKKQFPFKGTAIKKTN